MCAWLITTCTMYCTIVRCTILHRNWKTTSTGILQYSAEKNANAVGMLATGRHTQAIRSYGTKTIHTYAFVDSATLIKTHGPRFKDSKTMRRQDDGGERCCAYAQTITQSTLLVPTTTLLPVEHGESWRRQSSALVLSCPQKSFPFFCLFPSHIGIYSHVPASTLIAYSEYLPTLSSYS